MIINFDNPKLRGLKRRKYESQCPSGPNVGRAREGEGWNVNVWYMKTVASESYRGPNPFGTTNE